MPIEEEFMEMSETPSTSSSAFQPCPLTITIPPEKNPGRHKISSSSSEHKNPTLVEKVIRKQYQLRTINDRSVSYAWVILPCVCYFSTLVGGLMTCIGVGNVLKSFDYCIFHANFSLTVATFPNGTKSLVHWIPNEWGNKNDCLFSEYGSVTLSLFSGIWIVMVLQCGRGGASKRGFRLPDAWRIVAPTCLTNTVTFIISSIILSSVSSGFTSFCENSLFVPSPPQKSPGELNSNITCREILSFDYFTDRTMSSELDLMQQYRISEIGATVMFLGCLAGFLIVLLRCFKGPDFDLYVRREVVYVPANTNEDLLEQDLGNNDDDEDEEEEDEFAHELDTSKSFMPIVKATVICHPNPDDDNDSNNPVRPTRPETANFIAAAIEEDEAEEDVLHPSNSFNSKSKLIVN